MSTAKTTAKTRKKTSKRSHMRQPETLIGKCLVYIGSEKNELYNHAVIYINKSTADEVQGIMVNKLLFGNAVMECKKQDNNKEQRNVYEDLYQGGPENTSHGYVLFPKEDSVEDDPFSEVQGDIAISTSFGVLQEIMEGSGPNRKIIAMGHCKWNRGELEWEIFNNQWLIIPCSEELLFETKFQDRWEQAHNFGMASFTNCLPQIGLA